MKKLFLLLFFSTKVFGALSAPYSPFYWSAPFSTPQVIQAYPSASLVWIQPPMSLGVNFPPIPGATLTISSGFLSMAGNPLCLNDCSGTGGGTLNGDGGTLTNFGGYGLTNGALVEDFGYILLYSDGTYPLAFYTPGTYTTLLGGPFNFNDGSGSGGGAMSVDGGTIDNIGTLGIEESNGVPSMGRCTLVSGTCTVSTSAVAANSEIFLTEQDCATANAVVENTRTAGTGFTIKSSLSSDNCIVSWLIIQPN
jgi:hypothetical protein